jgi:hypothetical protein
MAAAGSAFLGRLAFVSRLVRPMILFRGFDMPARGISFASKWAFRALLTGLMGVLSSGQLHAEPTKDPNVQQPVERGKLEAKYTKDLAAVIKDLTNGKASPKESPEAVDVLAQWHTFRVTWNDNQTTIGAMDRVINELDRFLDEATKNKATVLLEAFTSRAVEHLKLVLQNDRQLARVNGARVLARLAKTGQETTADLLVETVADPQQNDGVKYYAFQGLRELFAQANQPNPTIFQGKVGKEREGRCLEALVKAAGRKVPGADELPREEREGIRFVRREALHALAMNRRPGVTDDKGALVLRPAQVLAQAARADGLVPEPRLDERVEAAIGLARQSPKAFDGYQADYAAYQLAWFTADFARASNTATKELWKTSAARLIEAFEGMKAETAALKDGKNIAEFLDKSLGVLKAIERDGKGDARDLVSWLSGKELTNKTLYKGVADSAIKEGPSELREAPEKTAPPDKKPEEKKAEEKKPGEK